MDDDELRQRFGPCLRAELEEIRDASQETAVDRAPIELDQQSVGRLSRRDALQNQAMAAAQEVRRAGPPH